MAEAHVSLAIRLAHLLHDVWSNIRTWVHEQKRSIAGLCIPSPDILEQLNALYVDDLYTVNQKTSPGFFKNDSIENRPICLIIGTGTPEDICNHTVVMCPTSPE